MRMRDRTKSIAKFIVSAAVGFLAAGCAKYYQVTDPSTGKVYYTTQLQEKGSAVTLRDGGTGSNVTIQNSEIAEVSKERYESGRIHSGRAPAPKPAPVVAVAKPAPTTVPASAPEAAVARGTVAANGSGEAAAAVALATSAATLRDQLVDRKQTIDQTLTALSELTAPGQTDFDGAYKRYCDRLDRLNQQAEHTRQEAAAMRDARAEYFARWEGRIAEVSNPTIRQAAEERKARLRDAQERIVTSADELRQAYRPFVADLEDVRKFLAAGATADTTAVLGPTARKARDEGAVVKQKIDALVAELDTVDGGLQAAPAGERPPATPAPSPAAEPSGVRQ